jgi:hypothetical protein
MTCAVCAGDRGPFAREPLGRGDALVNVCAECRTAPARTRTGPERGYEPSGGLPSQEESAAGVRRVMGPARAAAESARLQRESLRPAPARDRAEVDAEQVEYDGARRRHSSAGRGGLRSSREKKLH